MSPNPLEQLLIERIRKEGPITIADYMSAALSHPTHGYYMTRSPFGPTGDFTTAPEISQIFGELIGAWLIEAWRDIGSPAQVNLIELGPGRGTLMRDTLRVARLAPDFARATHIYMVETSQGLRTQQQKTLAPADCPISWVASLDEIPPAPCLILANEFLDCLPIRQFICFWNSRSPSWYERLVGIDRTAEEQTLCLTPAPTAWAEAPPGDESQWPTAAKHNDIFEINIGIPQIIGQIAERFHRNKGRALIIDYGYRDIAAGDTLQAVKAHQFCDPLASPGHVDITAHVSFGAVGRLARARGLTSYGPVGQGTFLNHLGAQFRLEALCRSATEAQADILRAGLRRLTHPNEMGELFKVLCLANPPNNTGATVQPPGPPAGFPFK